MMSEEFSNLESLVLCFKDYCSWDERLSLYADLYQTHWDDTLRQLLSAMPHLEYLDLTSPCLGAEVNAPAHTDLQKVFGTLKWPNMQLLCIRNVRAAEDDFVQFLLKHNRLHQLGLSDIHFSEGARIAAFKRIAEKFPNLHLVDLGGRSNDVEAIDWEDMFLVGRRRRCEV